jgi:predicted aspartyl protease
MGLRMLLAGGVGLLLAAASTLQASAQDVHRPCPDFPLPFDLVSGFEVVVRGQVGELDGLRFILDTGSSYSVLDRRVADRMRLDRHPGKVFNFNRSLAIEWADVPEVGIGPLRVAGIRMMVARLRDIAEFAENADGIIGLDVLSRAQKIAIDYERRRVSFELDDGCGIKPHAVKALVMTVAIQGVPMRLLIDTGLGYVLLYKDRFSAALPHLRTEGEPRYAAFGRLQATRVDLPGVQVFRPRAVTPVFLIEGPGTSPETSPETSTPEGIDGYLGPASLHAKRLELDFAAMTLRWQ